MKVMSDKYISNIFKGTYQSGFARDILLVKNHIRRGDVPEMIYKNWIRFGDQTYNGIGLKKYEQLVKEVENEGKEGGK